MHPQTPAIPMHTFFVSFFCLDFKDPRGKFLFFQLPDSLPITMETSKEEPMEVEGASQTSSKDEVPTPAFVWRDLFVHP